MDWGMEMKAVFLIGAGALALALSACDAGPSATSKAPGNPPASITAAGQTAQAGSTTSTGQSAQTASVDPRDAPAPLAEDGKPIWAANKKHTAQENADYQFGKNGKDFGAATEADYVAKAHAFVDAPPSDVQKVERSNGDALLYDAKSNTFAVATKTGAPRTMFKPRDGAAYWTQQVTREQSRSNDDKSES
jgi:pyocin large subunit-like protein